MPFVFCVLLFVVVHTPHDNMQLISDPCLADFHKEFLLFREQEQAPVQDNGESVDMDDGDDTQDYQEVLRANEVSAATSSNPSGGADEDGAGEDVEDE